MRTRITIGIVAVVALGLLVACGDDDTTPTPTRPSPVQPVTPTQPAVTAQNLTIQGPTWFADSNELEVDQTAQLRANLELSDGSTREDVDAEWTSSNTTVATVSADGLLTGRQPGGFDLRATAEGLTARVSGIRVVPKPVPWRTSGTGATILDLPTRIRCRMLRLHWFGCLAPPGRFHDLKPALPTWAFLCPARVVLASL